MKESSWEECLENNSSVAVSKDKAKAKSLFETAQARLKFLKGNIITNTNSNFIFEGYYSSALEMLHAFILLHGYKVANHVCLGYYLRDIMKMDDLFRIFDDSRFKRNSLVYYGKQLDFNSSVESINKIELFIKELSLLLKKELEKK